MKVTNLRLIMEKWGSQLLTQTLTGLDVKGLSIQNSSSKRAVFGKKDFVVSIADGLSRKEAKNPQDIAMV